MLLKNISTGLVNGKRGRVLQLHENSIDVTFKIAPKAVTISPPTFTTYDPIEKQVIAKRVQFPLKLAYAITTHKAQGMSLEQVVVNCQNCTQPGQIGVAVGRARTVEGLRVLNIKKHSYKRHPGHVYDFYKDITLGNIKKRY